jgi:hypothetical protein
LIKKYKKTEERDKAKTERGGQIQRKTEPKKKDTKH